MPTKWLDALSSRGRKLAIVPANTLDKASRGKLTPNMVSFAAFILHLPIAWLITQGHLGYAGLFLAVAAPLDALDGALARAQDTTSSFGTVLDASLDRAKEILLYSALVYYFANADQASSALAACLALGSSILVSYIKAKTEMASPDKKGLSSAQLNRIYSGGMFRFELRMLILIAGLGLGQPLPAVIIIAIGSNLTAVQRLLLAKSVLR